MQLSPSNDNHALLSLFFSSYTLWHVLDTKFWASSCSCPHYVDYHLYCLLFFHFCLLATTSLFLLPSFSAFHNVKIWPHELLINISWIVFNLDKSFVNYWSIDAHILLFCPLSVSALCDFMLQTWLAAMFPQAVNSQLHIC